METLGTIAGIWRYPVKSLRAQALTAVQVWYEGLEGDRAGALEVRAGHERIGKPYRGKENNLLHTVDEARIAAALAADRGVRVALQSQPGARYFDDAPISLVFDRWIAQVERALGEQLDPLRWRPNFFARAHSSFAYEEADLIGACIETGEVVLRVRDVIRRCVTTTYDVQTGQQNPSVLRYVAQHRDNVMGIYCEVELAGVVRAGDLLRLRER